MLLYCFSERGGRLCFGDVSSKRREGKRYGEGGVERNVRATSAGSKECL